jgi:hypothetical protein
MGEAAIRDDQAWLLQSRINPFPISGALELRDGRLSFTLNEMAAEAALGWLEEELGSEDLKPRIEAGETVVAFDYPLASCKVSWPLTGGGAMMFIEGGARKWVVSYDYPSGGAVSQTMSMLSGRKKARDWKKALAAAAAEA